MGKEIVNIPTSVVIPTKNRNQRLHKTLDSIDIQNHQPKEVIIIDASNKLFIAKQKYSFEVVVHKAKIPGAAKQRNQGVSLSEQPFIYFMDDDIDLEPGCIEKMWKAIHADAKLGGVNAMITNQQYHSPGKISKILWSWLNGSPLDSYAGKCLGPVFNLLPEDRDDLPEVVPVEWINTTCALYRKEALPVPPFPDFFKGYSMFEDVTVSSLVGRKWKLANVRTARIFHDSQPGDHKNSMLVLSRMELVNRYLVMTRILERKGLNYNFQLSIVELYKLLSYFSSLKSIVNIPYVLAGKLAGIYDILFKTKSIKVDLTNY